VQLVSVAPLESNVLVVSVLLIKKQKEISYSRASSVAIQGKNGEGEQRVE